MRLRRSLSKALTNRKPEMNEILRNLFGNSQLEAHENFACSPKSFIELHNVNKRYNSLRSGKGSDGIAVEALKEINLEIELNQITVFKGSSGAGKTTLLTVIGAMAKPTSGRVRINGLEISSLSERFLAQIRRKSFGFIFQNYNLIRGVSAIENTMLPAYPTNNKPKEIRRKAYALLEKLEIGHRAAWSVERLSGGERQRVAIARALINDPEVVIADEPTAHLNTELTEKFSEIIAQLKCEGKTVLIATHDPLLIELAKAHQVFELRDGKMVAASAKERML